MQGPCNRWFCGESRDQGGIHAGGVDREVTLDEADFGACTGADAAYRRTYDGRSPSIIEYILTPAARESTLKLPPRRALARSGANGASRFDAWGELGRG
ncbi:DUF2255 family protein [Kitasatospora sp. NPDC057965]|uniref:DUF2255 family protein n=1 Tax=Kitasatospora sp. NPDC057965 TaxID=3346291 RepID=UPI0036DF6DD8